MTKPTIQLLKKGNDGLKSKLETLTKDFKELLMKKESTARTKQDGGSSSPNYELENIVQFLSDEYGDLQDSHSATLCVNYPNLAKICQIFQPKLRRYLTL